MCVCCVVCIFNDPATTEIYTYLHTLSLHGALPIWMTFLLAMQAPAGTTMAIVPGLARAAKGRVPVATDVSGMAFHKVADEHWAALPMPPQDDPERRVLRSEEHTSELQSLMRISYAVFCLNKKHTQ